MPSLRPRYLAPLAASLILLAACSQSEPDAVATPETSTTTVAAETPVTRNTNETERLNAWFERRFDEEALARPEYLAQLGRTERQDEWNDETRAAYLDRVDRARADLEFLTEEIDVDALDEDAKLSRRLYMQNAQNMIDGLQWRDHTYSFTQMRGAHASIPTFLLNNHKVTSEADARNYIARLNTIPGKLDTIRERAAENFEKGIAPPRFVYAHTIGGVDNMLSGAPFEDSDDLNLLLEDFRKKVNGLDIPEETREELFTEAIDAVDRNVGPAYRRLREELVRQQSKATTDDGAWKLPDGDDYYAYMLRMMTTTDLTADEIHNIGLREVERIHAEMREIMEAVNYDGTLQEFFEFMRTDEQFYYPTTNEGKERYLREATSIIDTIEEELPDYFMKLPEAELEVRAVEPFRERAAGKAFYSRPAADGSRPGYYYANLYDMAQMPIYQMEALAYHEGSPGHHMQVALAQELEGVPSFRKFGRFTAYTEGWGLYSEFLPKEMGFYQDPYSDFGRLAMELWRAGRLVVDTGLHSKRWTREEAIDYLAENTPNPQGDIVKAIERYIVMPGQATAYMIGKLKIVDLREEAKEQLGDTFDIREYHDVVLSSGPVPLDVLEERVPAWVESKG